MERGKDLKDPIDIHRKRLNGFLRLCGVLNIELTEVLTYEREIASLISGMDDTSDLKAGKHNRYVLHQLGIDPNKKVLIEKQTINFTEDHIEDGSEFHKIYSNRPREQSLTHYQYIPDNGTSIGKTTVCTFSHGGSIRVNTSGSDESLYLALLHCLAEKEGLSVILNTVNHRGSTFDDKSKYSVFDRMIDVAIAQHVSIAEENINKLKITGKNLSFALMGNSMGGDVIAMLSPYLKPDLAILSQPAAYIEESHFVPLGREFSEMIRTEGSWVASSAFFALEEYLMNGGKALIIGSDEDKVVPSEVIQKYALKKDSFLERKFFRDKRGNYPELFWVEGGHHETSEEEIRIIVEYLR